LTSQKRSAPALFKTSEECGTALKKSIDEWPHAEGKRQIRELARRLAQRWLPGLRLTVTDMRPSPICAPKLMLEAKEHYCLTRHVPT
jgi:hypothetical protein